MVDHGQTNRSDLKVLIIEKVLAEALGVAAVLSRAGIQTAWGVTAAAGLELKGTFLPDIALVDLDLPDVDGFDLVSWLSDYNDCGIIVLSDHATEEQIALCLERGADDCITKPPRPLELVARVCALARRIRANEVVKLNRIKLTAQSGGIELDIASRLIRTSDGGHVSLTTAEYKALTMLLAANGKPVSRNRLSLVALHREWCSADRSVDQLIFSLRQKVSLGSGHRMIHSIRGVGYMLSSQHVVSPNGKKLMANNDFTETC